ncbi:glutamate racemase [Tetragenococcus halophilus]|uniref:Glutamate racemase n=1 Tax=Tetragenococcus halophilus (strain DSM 20338 / JCM 20259 / NCIMB 9735 / NBRC 12172) TaxID=945021 RepID=A0AAN1VR37_TETHN|nr:glutamate racemase [Tetragenococcus halophilus NBRC 12172]GBD71872.1 glutamate racemase [Tetragenococcus halophilus subsp. halophilus]GFK21871.1 glutamate racemase [Tetragenococcus halophilus]GBD74906.1 glutamate racemase [Tetragenococcus halophilus subsp. halophilus]GFK28814.1 glutamate racemase [Tetragenococcus halophilus]
MNDRPIGFIDSGVGGLTVVKEAMKQLPNENFIYLGDTARCPYGPRPKEQVIEFTWEMTHFLLEKNIKMLVIACNTATAVALDTIKDQLAIPVVGVIMPGTRAAVKATKNKRIGVIATQGTVKSASYERAIKEKFSQIQVESLACPKFVPIVESNQFHSSVAKKVVFETLRSFKNKHLDTLILGCTHYPLLRPVIQDVMGKDVTLIDSGAETISEVSMLLDYFSIANAENKKKGDTTFYTTGSTQLFDQIAQDWLGKTMASSKQIALGGTDHAS